MPSSPAWPRRAWASSRAPPRAGQTTSCPGRLRSWWSCRLDLLGRRRWCATCAPSAPWRPDSGRGHARAVARSVPLLLVEDGVEAGGFAVGGLVQAYLGDADGG